MENLNQVEVIKNVLELEKNIDELTKILSSLQSAHYFPEPQPPVHETVERKYPEITLEKTKMNKAILLTGPIGVAAYGIQRHKDRQAEIERIRNSEEYKNQCAEADRKFDQMQAEKDREYEDAKKEYDTVTLPKYREDLENWTITQKKRIIDTQQKLEESQKTLSDIYEATKIVPMNYRTIDCLQHVYDVISTSNYDVTYALDDYNRERQRQLDRERIRLEEARLYEQQLANDLADEGNQIADVARRQNNLASVIGTVQKHNTNKILKDWTKRK